MARRLAHGRLTKEDPGETIRQNGLVASFGNKGIFGNHLDQLLFESGGYEHILGSVNQVSSKFATITYDQVQQRFEDINGDEVILDDYDRIAVIGMDVLTADMLIDNVTGLEIFHIGNTPGQVGGGAPVNAPRFQMGDVGGGVPFKIIFGSNTAQCKLALLTDQSFAELQMIRLQNQLSLRQILYIANQGLNNHITVNGTVIYNPSEAGQIIKYDTQPDNPYLLRMDGGLYVWAFDPAFPSRAWFRDLNIALDGQRWDGTQFVETQSRFTNPVTIPGTPWLFQLNTAKRFFTDLDPTGLEDTRIHSRTNPTLVSIAATADFVNSSNVVTFQGGIGNIKNGMRISGALAQGIPDGAAGTTILRNINITTGTAQMFNALTGAPVNATSTVNGIAVTMNNSGAAGGSHDEDALQNITGSFEIRDVQSSSAVFNTLGAFTLNESGPQNISQFSISLPSDLTDIINFDASQSTSPENAKTHPDQTQPKSSGVYYYYKV